MNSEQLKKGNELEKIIRTTEKAVKDIELFKIRDKEASKSYDDGVYNLSISEYKDGSGNRLELTRYFGNAKLLELIKSELQRQLNEYTEMLENL